MNVNINDIVRLNNGGKECRLALVLDVLTEINSVVVALIHPYTEYATEMDIVFPSTVTSVSYDIVVQGDVVTTTSLNWIDKIVGNVPTTTPPLNGGWYQDTIGFQPILPVEIYKGYRLLGILDTRWNFKVQEGKKAMDFTCLPEELIEI